MFETAEYHFYGALSRAASCDGATAGERHELRKALAAHHEQLRIWAENCPENFGNRAALVDAEIARLESRELDAERLYEQAIRSARANGFIHNEALAYEVAAHFYAGRGFEELRTQLADGLPLIQGDRVQLQQVILNLIVNAVQAMSSVSEGVRDLLISTGTAGPDRVLVAVRDSGPGLPPSSAERLFDAFYTTKADGMGMGLSICRSMIEAHGGRLWASANEPRGAVFRFTVPAHPEPT